METLEEALERIEELESELTETKRLLSESQEEAGGFEDERNELDASVDRKKSRISELEEDLEEAEDQCRTFAPSLYDVQKREILEKIFLDLTIEELENIKWKKIGYEKPRNTYVLIKTNTTHSGWAISGYFENYGFEVDPTATEWKYIT